MHEKYPGVTLTQNLDLVRATSTNSVSGVYIYLIHQVSRVSSLECTRKTDCCVCGCLALVTRQAHEQLAVTVVVADDDKHVPKNVIFKVKCRASVYVVTYSTVGGL